MMFRKRFMAKVVSVALLGGLSLSANSATTLKLSHNVDEQAPVHKAMQFFADKVHEKTDEEVRIRIYPNSQLGTQRESMELLQAGALDMVKSNASEMESFDPSYGAFNIPYLFQDRDHYYRALKSEDVGGKILDSSKQYGFVGITYYDSGARSFYANKPIRTPSDLSGLKIRVQPSPTAVRMIELLGASPTPLPYGELYTALQQGVVDGAENNINSVTTYRHGEVVDYYSLDEHTMIPDVLVISTQSWEQLTPSQQSSLKEAGQESMEFMKEIWSENIDREMKKAKEMGVEIIKVDKGPFIEAVKPMHDEALQAPDIAPYVKAINSLAD
ncbi:TRAP transporter substrate-binding protein [Halomonas sp. EGI 63088]|uniref:TRAP transporter substrate-binding protein n=1 Tax=Halomonas flagellata TaxID=2920385 RepID=A0ABS9S0A5_9GAMM|nr:TRAP transporter substrate-binding protein [Halomonas flagellata]MCH4565484.1 TRAP transporter substrate-binding protein [Halomonas flagellata]